MAFLCHPIYAIDGRHQLWDQLYPNRLLTIYLGLSVLPKIKMMTKSSRYKVNLDDTVHRGKVRVRRTVLSVGELMIWKFREIVLVFESRCCSRMSLEEEGVE